MIMSSMSAMPLRFFSAMQNVSPPARIRLVQRSMITRLERVLSGQRARGDVLTLHELAWSTQTNRRNRGVSEWIFFHAIHTHTAIHTRRPLLLFTHATDDRRRARRDPAPRREGGAVQAGCCDACARLILAPGTMYTAPANDSVPAAHGEHALCPAEEYVLTPHCWQLPPLENCPAVHCSHALPPYPAAHAHAHDPPATKPLGHSEAALHCALTSPPVKVDTVLLSSAHFPNSALLIVLVQSSCAASNRQPFKEHPSSRQTQ